MSLAMALLDRVVRNTALLPGAASKWAFLIQQELDLAQEKEMARWVDAMKELGFAGHPGLSVKENLRAFGNWWMSQK